MSFRLKTILGIALIQTTLLLVLVFSNLYFLRDSNEEQLLERTSTTSRLFASATKDAVLATDLARLEAFIEEILYNPEIVYVRIRDANGMVLAEGSNKLLPNSRIKPDQTLQTVDDGTFDTVAHIVEGDMLFGRVELGFSIESLARTFDSAKNWAVGIATAEVLLVALFSFLLGTYLTRGLQQLRIGSRKIIEEGPGHQLQVTGNDEVAEVANAFNNMSLALKTNYEKLEESLKESDQMLGQAQRARVKNQAILASSLDAVVSIDQQGKVIDFNKAAEKTFGWKFEEIKGKSMTEYLIPHDRRKAHEAGMQHYVDSGESRMLNQRLKLEALNKNGDQFPVELTIADIQTPDGPIFTAFLRDISREVLVETELRLAATAFETIEPMFITDHQATIIRVNDALLKSTGYQAKEVIGQNPRLWSSGKHSRDFFKTLWQQLLDKGHWSGEIYNKRKNGEVYPEYVSISAVRDTAGQTTHYITQSIDISEQKAREQQLEIKTHQAKKAEEAKSRFLAVMSHEIRTPLNAVLGMIDLLRETELTQEQKNLLLIGLNSGELLLSVINNILDFSRMDAGKLALDNQPFDLHATISQSVELLRHHAQRKKLALILRLEDSLPHFARGDKTRLRQVLVNLISNAVKFTEHGSVTVTAAAVAESGDILKLSLTIRDTGSGIPKELQESLFNEFSQLDQSETRRTGGTGLGLSISKRLVDLMGGKIGVDSQINSGSCFYFNIKLGTHDGAGVTEEPPNNLACQFPATRILLAEDNPANQDIFTAMLASTGVHLDIASDGSEAVTALKKQPYDLVLMDVSMPRMDGVAATRAIRSLPGFASQTPIIAITAHGMPSDRERFIEAGMNDYLSKPVRKAQLLSKISLWAKSLAEPETRSPGQEALIERLPEGDVAQDAINPSITADNGNEWLDEAVLQQLISDTSVDIVPALLEGYIEDVLARLTHIGEAAAQADPVKLEFETHTIGSSAAAHGNPALHQLARNIEHLCRGGETKAALEKVGTLQQVAEASLNALQQRIQTGFTNQSE